VLALAQRALAPLRRLAASAKLLARGDLKQRVEVTSSDEIGTLAGEFNAMAAALEEREQRLLRSERLAAIGKIAAQITHEVRNPLSSIGLNAELILEELERSKDAWGSGEARELVRAIIGEVDRLAAITEQYLRLARLPRPQLEREDLNALVSSLLAFVHEELVGRKVIVETRFCERLPTVPADENQLRQALLNLLRNAAEAMPGGGRITVETGLTDDPDRPVRVSVTDTGSGIATEIRAKIFEPFFSTKQGGTGLGLALTQQIIVEHGGAIDIESEPGEGTRFTVRLPAMPAEPIAAVEPAVLS
jgi:two-component system, NtrC family, sensor kinase